MKCKHFSNVTKNHLFFSYRFPDQSDPVCIQGTPSFGSSWPKSWSSTRHWGILCQCPRHCIRQCWFPNQVYRYCYSLQQQGRQVHWTHVVVFGPWSFASSWFHFPWIAMGCYAGMYSHLNFVLLHLCAVISYEIKSPPWTIWWFRILGIFSWKYKEAACFYVSNLRQ